MRRKVLVAVLFTLAWLVGGTIWSFMPSPLPAPAQWSGALPDASPPPSMAIYQLPTGSYQTPASLAFRGGSFFESRGFVATAILVRHPKGDLLFDAGFGANVETDIALLPRFQRAHHDRGETVHAQLTAIGYDFRALRGVVITHAHWDHVSGLPDLPAPVWMNAEEQHYANEDHAVTRLFRSFSGIRIQRYDFDGPPYLGFPSSHDVWGDGSIVLVPAGGHTPGSIVAFVAMPSGKRYALIGDLTWQLDGIEGRAERPLLLRVLADCDPSEVRKNLARIGALAGRMQIVPAHDGRAYADIPRLR
jgi:glyoxylase-like metal-dependent hydrolase (beta-lactamase superfamily II)